MSLLSQLQGLITALGADIKSINTALTQKQESLGFTPINKAGDTMTGTLNLMAGTSAAAPMDIPSATNLMTNAAAGSFEYDGLTFYFSPANNSRGAVLVEQIIALNATNTLTSQTAVQPIFDGGGGPTNGAITLPIGAYQFECNFSLTGMSATSGSFGFAIGGTATKTQSWNSIASKSTATSLTTATASASTFSTAANTAIATAGTGTVGTAIIKGILRVTAAGTVIPQVSLGVASAAVIQANSYFKISSIGNSTATQLGNVS